MGKWLSMWLSLLLAAIWPLAAAAADDQAQQALWQALRAGGHVIMLRHAKTEPGIGDPPNFKIGDCRTQRNLSAAGRSDARRIGAAFQRYAIPVDAVLSSQWCRCIDTAKLAFGRVQPVPALNSMFMEAAEHQRDRVEKTYRLISDHAGKGNLVLVTHAVNIQALTALYPGSGDMVVLRADGAGGIQVLGQLDLPAQ